MKSNVKQTLVQYRFHLAEINHILVLEGSAQLVGKKTQTCFAQNKDILEISVPYSMVSRCASCRGGECEGTLSCYARVVLSSWSAAQEFPLQQINKTFQLNSAAGKEKKDHCNKRKSKSVWLTCYCPRRSWQDRCCSHQRSALCFSSTWMRDQTKHATASWPVSLHTPSLVAGAPPPCHSPIRMLTWA